MNFCEHRVHCHHCRDRERPELFRRAVMAQFGGVLDFACPEGLPWDCEQQAPPKRASRPKRPPVRTRYGDAVAKVEAMPDCEAKRFLVQVRAQLEDLMNARRSGTCADRKAFVGRMREKMIWYVEQYGTATLPPLRRMI